LEEWKQRGVGNSYQEALLRDVVELQTQMLLQNITTNAEECVVCCLLIVDCCLFQGSLLVQLNATYRNMEESLVKLMPPQTKRQLNLLEGVVR
ncbi:unnamed protein product, partial [Choristocarpus tenellus]